MLSRDAILQADDLQYETVEVPEWGGAVRVRGMTGTERDAYTESSMVDARTGEVTLADMTSRLLVRTLVDEEGDRLFSDADVRALGRKSGAALDRVARVAQRLSGLSQADMEALVKNSEASRNGGSGSG